jgi:hypothetical protein
MEYGAPSITLAPKLDYEERDAWTKVANVVPRSRLPLHLLRFALFEDNGRLARGSVRSGLWD